MPGWFNKRNRYGVAQNSVVFLGVIAALIVAFNIPIGVLLGTFSLLTLVCNMVLFIPAMKIHKLYPNCYKHAYLKIAPPIVIGMSVIGIIVSIWQIWSLAFNLSKPVVIALICWVGGWYVFFFARKAYLKKRGVDLNEIMSTPYEEWTKREKELE